ncbi:MAG: sulfatase, partial [Acidobacteriota bacterium]
MGFGGFALRRGGLKAALAAACLLGACAEKPVPQPAARPAPVERQARPLLLVTLDTTRADFLQPYGADHVATPTLLRLAREGVLFEQTLAVAPITLVAHTSLLTGLYPPRHGVRNNGIHRADPSLETLPETLGRAGYRSAAFVSASVLEKRYGLDQGFEHYDDDLSTGTDRRPRVVPDRPATATVNAALQWLEQAGDADRFFLWVHFYDPHAAYTPPAPYRDRYRDDLPAGEIAYMDAELGRLLEHPSLADAAVAVIG